MPTARTIAEMFQTLGYGQTIKTANVTVCGPDGYAVHGLDRPTAHRVARAILSAFEADPEAGLPMLRLTTGWRGQPGHTVRVTISRTTD